MIVPTTYAADKMDGDAWLKLVFHGKPGTLLPMPMLPKAMAEPSDFLWPWEMTKKPAPKK